MFGDGRMYEGSRPHHSSSRPDVPTLKYKRTRARPPGLLTPTVLYRSSPFLSTISAVRKSPVLTAKNSVIPIQLPRNNEVSEITIIFFMSYITYSICHFVNETIRETNKLLFFHDEIYMSSCF